MKYTSLPVNHVSGLLLGALLFASGCPRSGVELVIMASSDLTPYEEVDHIEVELVGVGLIESTSVDEGDALDDGLEVYRRRHANIDGRHVRVSLLRAGVVVLTRDLIFDHQADREIHVLLPRECAEIDCGRGETCVLGACAAPECVDGSEDGCPEATCTASSECVAEAACASTECRDGACLAFGDDSECDGDTWCDPQEGCVARRTAVRDGGVGDGGGGDAGVGDAGDAGVGDAGDGGVDDGGVDDGGVDDAGDVDPDAG